ncbi:Tetratricopeptide repeat-containing protein [Gracilibacillus orientalis]|uniref:Tetratricopeptide repeat-containing protein n=1 Tax=Gracilibacillus orientalis TaxID=334253 RepID=A0A1I4L2H1_9BACI|nr:tetratricopeptide repeat protein [Gracilibacillus orientalis]SFL85212.1 Tetratricopeptide repeat-containing protein [Gracilibacillus orientalis]
MNTIEQAIEMIHAGEVKEALTLLNETAISADIDTKLEISHIFIELGNHDLAEELLEDILVIEPHNSETKLLLSDIMIDDNKDERAIELLNEIELGDENYLQALVQLADLYQAQGLFEVAERKLITAKNIAPEEAIIDFALGELLFTSGEYHKSIIYYEKLRQTTEEFAGVNITSRLAEAYALNGDFEASLDHYQTLDTEDPETLFRYGFLAYKSERYEIAIQAWEKLLEEELEYPSVYLYLAKAYEEEGMIEEAYKTANQGVEMDPFNKEMWFTAGRIALKIGNTELAFDFVIKAISLDNEYQEALLFLVEAYKKQENDSEIIHLLTEQVDIEPLDGIFYWELAKAYYEEEEFKQALNAYQNAYNKIKQDTDFLKDYGYFLVEEGRISKALEVFEEFMALEPSDFDIQQYAERLKDQNNDTLF